MEQGVIKPWWNPRRQIETGRFKHQQDRALNDSRCIEFAEGTEEPIVSWGWPSCTPSTGCLANCCQIVWFSLRETGNTKLYVKFPKFKCLNVIRILKHFKVPCKYLWLGAAWFASVGLWLEKALHTVLRRRKTQKSSYDHAHEVGAFRELPASASKDLQGIWPNGQKIQFSLEKKLELSGLTLPSKLVLSSGKFSQAPGQKQFPL